MTTQKTQIDSYDDTKKMLNKIREIQRSSHTTLTEQIQPAPNQAPSQVPPPANPQGQQQQYHAPQQATQEKGFTVINNVQVYVDSADDMDLEINVEEKGKISQLIDDFHSEVSELAELNRLTIYADSAKLDGQITDVNLGFTLCTGDDSGLFLSNTAMIKMDENVMLTINKLKKFEYKFSSVINELIMARKQN